MPQVEAQAGMVYSPDGHGGRPDDALLEQGESVYGVQVSSRPTSSKSPPLTMPVLAKNAHAPEGQPPTHPLLFMHSPPEQHAAVSCGLSRAVMVALLAMQRRSLNASVDPKAQHAPQSLWSRTCEIEGQDG